MQELKGMPVVKYITDKLSEEIIKLKEKGITPKLAIIRVGENPDDISYEKGIIKRFSSVNALTSVIAMPVDVSQEKLEATIMTLNNDKSVHGILLFRPLPIHLSQNQLKSIIAKEKDVDCMGLINMALLFSGDRNCYVPCTAQAVIELLDFYGVDVKGKKVTIVGRSLVVGKPLSILLLDRNATITVCHTKTVNLHDECKKADILIACAGVAKMIDSSYVNSDQVVIDIGINIIDGKLCGDVDYEDVAHKVKAITPVPGGIGSITASVLLKNTIMSAME